MVLCSIFLIRFYQFLLSPDKGVLFPNHFRTCRFYPSCSEYTINALQMHGFFRGWWYGMCRVLRCNPWYEGGYDPMRPISGKMFSDGLGLYRYRWPYRTFFRK